MHCVEKCDIMFAESLELTRGIDMKEDKKYGIVLVGCGYIGRIHIEDIYDLPNVSLIGVVDYNLDAALQFEKRYNALSHSTDYREYLDDDRVDIFIIATYTQSHVPILLDAIAHGKHVLCEKPLSDNLADTEACIREIEKSDCKVLIGHILRHSPTYSKIAEIIQNGGIGEPKVMRIVQNHHALNWKRYASLLDHTSPIVDCGIHYIDLAQWLSGQRIIRLSGCGAILEPDVSGYNYGMLTMTLSGGAVAFFEAGWSKSIAGGNVKEFIGTKGRIRMVMGADRPVQHEEGDLIEWYETETEEYHIINMKKELVKDMKSQFLYLIAMIEQNLPANPSYDDVLSSMRAAFAGDLAIREGKTVYLE